MELSFGFWVTLLFIAIMMGVLQGTCAYLILAERKISAWAQDRLGPNRVGPWGLLQPIADGIKFLLKEDIIPSHVDKLFYLFAPSIAVSTALLAFAVVPFGPTTPPPVLLDYRPNQPHPPQAAWPQTIEEERAILAADREHAKQTNDKTYKEKLDEYNDTIQFVIAPHVSIGIVFNFAVGSLAVYGVLLGGWSSNNKYSMLGGLRSSAQLISYEIPLGMSVLGVLLVTGSLNLETIINYQVNHGWNILFQPLAALLFITSIFAECNRLPFDLPEAEQELVGGYHTEYSAMKFALFFLGEYTHMITTSFLVAIMFFGGWQLLPGLDMPGGIGGAILKLIVLAVKMALFIIFFMLIRWTLPRFRFDQLMGLTWKVLLPLALINILCVIFVKQFNQSEWLLLPLSIGTLFLVAGLALYMPRQRPRAPVRFAGHVGSGPPAVLHEDDAVLR
jgi:NADH-quinone oxidoreductase subunit H